MSRRLPPLCLPGLRRRAVALLGALAVLLCAQPAAADILFWPARLDFPVGQSYEPVSIAAGDLNGDQVPDLVVAYSNGDAVAVLLGRGDGTFAEASSYAAGDEPRSVAIGDLNGDQAPDLAVACEGYPGNIAVLLGLGDGTFGEASFYGPFSPGRPVSVAIGDLNGDQVVDLAVACHRGVDGVATLIGVGDGSFVWVGPWHPVQSPASLAIGDVNGDEILDVAVASRVGVAVLLGLGDGTLGEANYYAVGVQPRSVAIGDLNGDQVPDLAVADAGYDLNPGDVAILLGLGDGTFAEASFYSAGEGPVSVAIGDLNGDQVPDLAVAASGYLGPGYPRPGNTSVLLGVGDGSFAEADLYSAGGNPSSVAIADFDGDQVPDVALSVAVHGDRFSGKLSVFLGGGDGSFARADFYGVGNNGYSGDPQSVAIGDLNGDQAPDLAVANPGPDGYPGEVAILLGVGDGSFAEASYYGVGVDPRSVAIGDLNGDQVPDLAVANSEPVLGGVAVLLGLGDGTFAWGSSCAAGAWPTSVAVGDLNDDQVLDLAVADAGYWPYPGGVAILLGLGDGTFAPVIVYEAGNGSRDVAIGDLNGDQVPDLAVANWESGDVAVLLGFGDGTFAEASFYAAGAAPTSIAIGDLNGDHSPDLAVANFWSDDVAVLLGRGDGTLAEASFSGAGVSPVSVAVADLNGDQAPDLAVANKDFHNVGVLTGAGDGSFARASFYGTGVSPSSVAIADLDGDRVPDLAVANFGSDDVAVLTGCTPGPVAVEPPRDSRQRPGLLFAESRPNPFAATTTIIFSTPTPGPATVRIYDVTGRLVRSLLGENAVGVGEHRVSWDGRAEDGRRVASGVYLCRLRVGEQEMERKLHLLR